MDTARLDIYRASAGSGKTYTLATEYIKLLFDTSNPDALAHRHILAVTFTNKATMEMKQRILFLLDELRNGRQEKLCHDIAEHCHISQSAITQRANDYYVYILHSYDNFLISTIDSFFVQIVRACAYELGMLDDYTVQIDANSLITQAVNEIFVTLDKPDNKDLLQWLHINLHRRLKAEEPWAMKADMLNIGKELTKESYKEIMSRHEPFTLQQIEDYNQQLQLVIEQWQQHVVESAIRAQNIIRSHGLQWSDLKGGSRNGLGAIDKIASRNKAAIKQGLGKTAIAIMQDENNAITKSMKAELRDAITNMFRNGLRQALSDIVEHYNSEAYTDYLTACLIKKNITMVGLLSNIEQHYRDIANRQAKMMLENNGELISKIISNTSVPFIYEKIGVKLQHFLIDEFQDTSNLQWNNFRPLLLESLANNHSNMLVGDVKQSIYRWRNSNWHLMAHELPRDPEFCDFLHYPPLTTNYRSLRTIVEFNNNLFHFLAENIDQIRDNYGDVVQAVSPANSTNDCEHGYVSIDLKRIPSKKNNTPIEYNDSDSDEADNDGEQHQQAMQWIVRHIEDCRARGANWRDIAILVRKKKETQSIAPELNKLGYPITSQEALRIADAPCVQFLVDVISYFITPKTEIKYSILIHYALYVLNMDTEQALTYASQHTNDDLEELILNTSDTDYEPAQIRLMSLTEMAQTLMHVFRLDQWDTTTALHIQAFMDLIYEVAPAVAYSVPQFINWWKINKDNTFLPLPDNDAISIITIHKAKGLDFPVVLIPFCNWDIINKNDDTIIWLPTDNTPPPFNNIPLVPVAIKGAQNTHFQQQYLAEISEKTIDAVNELYVAFTRPSQELYVNISIKENSTDNVGVMVSNYLADNQLINSLEQEQEQNIHFGAPVQHIKNKPAQTGVVADTSHTPIDHDNALKNITLLNTGAYKALKFQPHLQGLPLTDNEEEITDIAQLPQDQHGNPWLNYGTLMHEMLSHITTSQDTDKALEIMTNSGHITRYEAEILRSAMDKMMAISGVQKLFNHPGTIVNEHPVICPDGKNLRPDRVMITPDNTAIIIDYKFGIEEHDAHHRQVRQYMNLYSQMGFKTQGYLIYGSLGKLVSIDK